MDRSKYNGVTVDLRNDFSEEAYPKDRHVWQDDEYTVYRNCVWSAPGCHQGCGVLYYVKDGKLEKVEGDPNSTVQNGRLCMRCLALPETVYNETRVTTPLKRVGERGENKWERITWDEAYDIVEENVRRVWDELGPKSILCLFGTGRNATWQLPFLGLVGFKTPNTCGGFLAGDACYAPRLAAMNAFMGNSFIADLAQVHSGKYDDDRWQVPAYIVMWGCDPLKSNSDGFYGHWVVDAMKRGSKLMTIDPRVTWLGARSDILIRLRPGTDTALAMAMLHVIVEEEIYDREFVEKWTWGFEDMKNAVSEMTPARAAEICWIKEDQIVRAARTLAAEKPWAMQWGVAIDHCKHATALAMAIMSLMAITGQIDRPGSNILVDSGYVQADIRAAVSHNVPPEVTQDRLGNDWSPLRKYGHISQAFTDAALHAIETGEPYPIGMVFISSTNTFANMAADAERVYRALKKVPFVAIADLWLTPTAVACADVFLPVATSPERDGIRGWWNPLRAIYKVIDVGEAKTDEEIALDLIKRLNPEDAKWDNAVELIDYVMEDLQSSRYEGNHASLIEDGEFYTDIDYFKYEAGRLRADGQPGFNTASGRVELFCLNFDDFDLPAVTYWEEPTESPVRTPELAEEYPFVLTTGQRSYEFFHSEHRQVKTMREFHPWPVSEMNPEDAAELGLEDGDWIEIENTHGKGKFKLSVNPGMRRGVVNAEQGWWFPEREGAEPELYGVFESNANCLTVQFDVGPHSYGSPYKNMLCRVKKAVGYHPPASL